MGEADKRENDLSVREGFRIPSAYMLSTGCKDMDHNGIRPERDDVPAARRILMLIVRGASRCAARFVALLFRILGNIMILHG